MRSAALASRIRRIVIETSRAMLELDAGAGPAAGEAPLELRALGDEVEGQTLEPGQLNQRVLAALEAIGRLAVQGEEAALADRARAVDER